MSRQSVWPLPGLRVLLGALVVLWAVGSTPSPSSAAPLTLVDEQVNVIDDAIDGWLSVYNTSATYLVEGAQVASSVFLYQGAWLEMSGGAVAYDLTAYTASELYLFGGSVGDTLRAQNSASIDWSGGSVGGEVVAAGSAVIRVYGSGFTVDGAPVPFGVLTAQSGLLAGTLNDGTVISVPFHHAGAAYLAETVTGTIELASGVPAQSPPPDNSHLVVLLNDGGVHAVDDDRFDDHPLGVRVRSPESPTTLRVLPGAAIGHAIVASQDGLVEISGGDVGFREYSCCAALYLTDQAMLSVTGGVVHGWTQLDQQSRGYIGGGTVIGEISLSAESTLDMGGGILHGPLTAYEDTHLTIRGGYVRDDLRIWGEAVIGGGGFGEDLIVEPTGRVEIVGSDFRIWGQPVPLGEVTATGGELTGTLENGEALRVYFFRGQQDLGGGETLQGRLLLVPEPQAAHLVVSGLAALLALTRRRGTRPPRALGREVNMSKM